nr:hypothetical protein [uncultured bacterium]
MFGTPATRRAWPLALALLVVSGLGFSEPASSGLSTEPARLPGVPAAKLGDFIVTDSGLTVAELKKRLGKASKVRAIAAGLEVSGVSAGHLAVTAHGLTQTALQITTKGRQVRPQPLDGAALSTLERLNDALVRYALSRNFGAPLPSGDTPSLARATYPGAKCAVLECSACTSTLAAPAECAPLERAKDGAYDAYMRAAALQEVWQGVVSALRGSKFYGGPGGTMGDLVGAASATHNAASASGAARGSATVLLEMARDGVLETTLEGLGLGDLSALPEAHAEARLAEAEAARVLAGNALLAARKPWSECMSRGAAGAEGKRAVIAYDGCRFRSYLGEAPECRVRESACP